MIIVVPTPLTSTTIYSKDNKRIIISREKLKQTHKVIIHGILFTDSEILGVAASKNQIKCLTCGDILHSIYSQHRVYCKCGKCSIDGGEFKLIRDCTGPFKELTTF